MIYRCANVLCGSRQRFPSPGGVCKNCAAPMLLVEEDYDDEDSIRDGMESVFAGFSELLSKHDVADQRASEEGL